MLDVSFSYCFFVFFLPKGEIRGVSHFKLCTLETLTKQITPTNLCQNTFPHV